jgi:hypothetical protein
MLARVRGCARAVRGAYPGGTASFPARLRVRGSALPRGPRRRSLRRELRRQIPRGGEAAVGGASHAGECESTEREARSAGRPLLKPPVQPSRRTRPWFGERQHHRDARVEMGGVEKISCVLLCAAACVSSASRLFEPIQIARQRAAITFRANRSLCAPEPFMRRSADAFALVSSKASPSRRPTHAARASTWEDDQCEINGRCLVRIFGSAWERSRRWRSWGAVIWARAPATKD